MGNVTLTKADGRVVNLHTGKFIGVLSGALDNHEEGAPIVRSVAVTTVRGLRFDNLASTAVETMEEVERAGGKKKGLFNFIKKSEMMALSCGDDFTYVMPNHVVGYEDFSDERFRIQYLPDNAVREAYIDVNNTPENRALLDAQLAKD